MRRDKSVDVFLSIILGILTGLMLGTSENYGVTILLGCIFWLLTFIYAKLPTSKASNDPTEQRRKTGTKEHDT